MTSKAKRLYTYLEPFHGIITFLILLFLFYFGWKWAISGDMTGDYIYLFDKNITPDWFFTLNDWLTAAAAWFIRLFPGTDSLLVGKNLLTFPDGMAISIIWGCTGIKHLTIFTGVMALYRWFSVRQFSYSRREKLFRIQLYFPPYNWNKWWYIPLGWVILSAYNIVRIGAISLLTRGNPDNFEFYHDHFFNYIYYGIMFLLWLVWEEVFVQKRMKAVRKKQ
ncbi:exosortase/archaeosortase family protein [Bacteroidales bacterium OttesenSCG-928-L03]|nr:exosortase/archaeosortase family protein [Bacteroidales bacterium OttesenSCG-928-L03]